MIISSDKQMIVLSGFYKQDGNTTKGITECSLFSILRYLIDNRLVNPETKIKVENPDAQRPNGGDGNVERLIEFFEKLDLLIRNPNPEILLI